MTLAGTAEDYNADAQLGLRNKIASEVGVDLASVSLMFVGASVQVKISITAMDTSQADAMEATLSVQLADAQTASTFLNVVVESVSAIEQVDLASESALSAESGQAEARAAGIAVGFGVVAIGLAGYYIFRRSFRLPTKSDSTEQAPLSEELDTLESFLRRLLP